MALVEQAVFTSAQTDLSSGYQLLGRSRGICTADASELRAWCPSHDSLAELDPDAVSHNFHPLPSGSFCVSQTTSAGWEYSGRGGHRVYTQCLIVSPEVLRQFANNPFALLLAAQAGGLLEVLENVPAELPSLQLAGRAAEVDQNLLARLAVDPGPERVAMFIQAALNSICLAVAGGEASRCVIPALFGCLPVECRTDFSFTTGLKFSSRRPFRVVALLGDDAERRWIAHQHNVNLLNLDSEEGEAEKVEGPTQLHGWAQLIHRVLSSGRTSFLSHELSKPRPDLLSADLPALGLQLLETFDASQFPGQVASPEPPTSPKESGSQSSEQASPPDKLKHAHAAHRRFEGNAESATAQIKALAPSASLDPHCPEVLQQLEHLDDVVFDAISGQETSLDELRTLWPEVCASLGEELLLDSREQYLRYALAIWEENPGAGTKRQPAKAVQALEVLCILFDQL